MASSDLSYIEKLVTLVPPPTEPLYVGSINAWKHAEQIIGCCYPDDYKELIKRYASGRFVIGYGSMTHFLQPCVTEA